MREEGCERAVLRAGRGRSEWFRKLYGTIASRTPGPPLADNKREPGSLFFASSRTWGNLEGLAKLPKLPSIDTRKESAKAAGVGERTYDAGKLILDAAPLARGELEITSQNFREVFGCPMCARQRGIYWNSNRFRKPSPRTRRTCVTA